MQGVQIDHASQTILSVAWSLIVRGKLRISREHSDGLRHCLELSVAKESQLSVKHGDVNLLVRFLLGEPQKAIALDARRAVSTVAGRVGDVLRAFGLTCKASEVPMLLVVMAHATREAVRRHDLEDISALKHDFGSLTISIRRPDEVLAGILSPCEYDVLRQRIDGLSYAQIAGRRQTSQRTIANQLARVYAKLGVSGRLSVMARLADRALHPGTALAANALLGVGGQGGQSPAAHLAMAPRRHSAKRHCVEHEQNRVFSHP